ncbi:MAG: hypothetical protein ACRCZ5_01410 [Burkholderiales bacterium]|jgi:hypothetical protein
MKHFISAAVLVCLAVPASAAETCRSFSGAIQLLPDPDCNIVQAYPGNAYLGALQVPNTCFSTELTRFGKGSSGLTAEVVYGSDAGQTFTPAMALESGVPQMPAGAQIPQTRQLFTGRTVLKTPFGTLFSADAGSMGTSGATEQAVIVAGTGAFRNARGVVYAYGDYIGPGKWGRYVAEICVPR